MATPDAEGTASLPFAIVKQSNGFSFDIGGSAAKLVYRDKRDWDEARDEPKQIEGGFAQIRTAIFQRERLDDVISYIQEHCQMTKNGDEKPTVCLTGIGCHAFSKHIEEKLNVSVKVVTEMDCFIKAFSFLRQRLTKQQLYHDTPASVLEKAEETKQGMVAMAQKLAKKNLSKAKFEMLERVADQKQEIAPLAEGMDTEPPPFLLGMLGSAFAFLKVEADESFMFAGGSNRGGRFFLGLGSLLTGAKSYGELMELAGRGNGKNVHQYVADLQAEGESDDMYAQMPKDHLTFCFGKAVNKSTGDFKREDLALALVQMLCLDTLEVIDLAFRTSGCQVLYLTGGFGSSPLVREILTEAFLTRALMQGKPLDCLRFVKHGSHLGAIGAFIQGGT